MPAINAISALQSSNSLGYTIGILAAGFLMDRIGFTSLFYFAGAIMLTAVGVFYVFSRDIE